MARTLSGKHVAILATDGFEQSELMKPRQALDEAGATTHLVSLKKGTVKGWDHDDWGETLEVDVAVQDADAAAYDLLVLPGGVMNPDKLRVDAGALAFVQAFAAAGKPIAAICHAPWTLINAGLVEGRQLTSYPTLRQDLENAGATWVDEQVVEDGNLITSRNPHDIPAFNAAIRRRLEA